MQQLKEPYNKEKTKLHKRTPKNIKNKKNLIDRLILKVKGIVDETDDIIEDILLKKGNRK